MVFKKLWNGADWLFCASIKNFLFGKLFFLVIIMSFSLGGELVIFTSKHKNFFLWVENWIFWVKTQWFFGKKCLFLGGARCVLQLISSSKWAWKILFEKMLFGIKVQEIYMVKFSFFVGRLSGADEFSRWVYLQLMSFISFASNIKVYSGL